MLLKNENYLSSDLVINGCGSIIAFDRSIERSIFVDGPKPKVATFTPYKKRQKQKERTLTCVRNNKYTTKCNTRKTTQALDHKHHFVIARNYILPWTVLLFSSYNKCRRSFLANALPVALLKPMDIFLSLRIQ